jgi:hypothetical protein
MDVSLPRRLSVSAAVSAQRSSCLTRFRVGASTLRRRRPSRGCRFKIWTQESFPVNARATVQGATMAVARFIAAGFALVTPALIDWSASGLYFLLTFLALVPGFVGVVITGRVSKTPGEAAAAPSALAVPVAGDAR